MKNIKTSDVTECNLNFEFKLQIGKRSSNRHNTRIYDVFLKLDKDFILFGRCYFRKNNQVKVIPNLSYFYIQKTKLEEECAKIIAFEITKILLIRL